MREILFRGKRIDNDEWVIGSLAAEYYKKHGVMMIAPSEDVIFKVDPDTIGQYTGLTDKNGEKIFEGDIVSYRTSCAHRTMKVIYQAGGFIVVDSTNLFRMSDLRKDFTNKHLEVIGNIHDNPELLEADNG